MVQFDESKSNERFEILRRSEEEKLVQTLAPQYGFEYINLKGYTINPVAIALLPEATARETKVAVFDTSFNTISVAAQNPNSPATRQAIEKLSNDRQGIKVFMCSHASLEHAWLRYKDLVQSTASKKGLFDINAGNIIEFTKRIKTKQDVSIEMGKIGTVNNARRITETLELMLAGARGLRASDIHIEPEETVVRLRYRLDGVLHDIFDIDRYLYARLLSRLKLLAGMTLNHANQAQDGRFTFEVGDSTVDVRASLIPGAAGDSMVMRLLDASVASYTLDKIELNPTLYEIVKAELNKPNGLLITTGPTGSGKTTALYAFLRETHEEGVKIITIENPVEYKIEGIVQTQIGGEYTFASGLRAILRQDPDVILIGEIRDKEVAETAIHAAQTGHLVLSTLHSNSAVASFTRLMDLGVDSRVFGSAINLILGQRLVRRLCQNCKTAYPASAAEQAVIETIVATHPVPPKINTPLTLYKATGCTQCNSTGYKGRAPIFEAILMDDKVEEAVLRDPREHVILEAAKGQGIPNMVEDGIVKVISGLTSFDELGRVIELPKAAAQVVAPPPTTPPNDADLFLAHVVT